MAKVPSRLQQQANGGASDRKPLRDVEEKQVPERPKRKKLWIISAVLAVIVVIAVVLSTTLTLLLNNNSNSSGPGSGGSTPTDQEKPYWPGWDGLNHLVFFGDSMTSVNFKLGGDQPSRQNPIGNPSFPGETSAILGNWAGFMTGTWNTSFIRTIDLAGGGATVDGSIFRSPFPGFRSFKTQAETDWIPNYSKSKPADFDWKQDDTLFVSFFGLNDCRQAYFQSKSSELPKVVATYVDIWDKLYSSGARNFLALKLSPLERAPNPRWNDASRKRELGNLLEEYNTKLTEALSQFSNKHPDAAVFIFDTHELYTKLLDDPCSYPETCAIKETTSICPAYQNERQDPFIDDPSCPYPLDKYFWINGLHPIYRVHNATAKAIVAYLNSVT